MRTQSFESQHAVPEHGEALRQLIAAVQTGDESACTRFVKTHQNRVHAVLWRMLAPVGKQMFVEDLTQETFLRVFRSLDTYDVYGSAKMSTWILKIATRLALNELRKKNKIMDVELHDLHLPADASADTLLRQKTLAQAVEYALSTLSSEQRSAFLLYEYHQLQLVEIAEILETKVGTVKSRLSRARKHVRHILSEVMP